MELWPLSNAAGDGIVMMARHRGPDAPWDNMLF